MTAGEVVPGAGSGEEREVRVTPPVPVAAPAPRRVKPHEDGASREVAVEVRGFSFWYGGAQALFDIDMEIARGAVTALIGPSGCGKSTFVRSINRMNELVPGANHRGEILVDGTDIHARAASLVRLRQQVGMVFQRPNPFAKSIFDNVAYGPRINGWDGDESLADIVERSLRRAALWDEVKDRLRSSAMGLSGGQQQRLCIARALATNPSVLLLDEPTASLDPASTQKVEELVYELRGSVTIVIVTHNLQQAARVSDFTAFFYLGRLVEMGTTEQIFTRPVQERTNAYVTGRFG